MVLQLELELVEGEDILEAGIQIISQPPGKKLQNMMQLSGGEKALTAIALLFAVSLAEAVALLFGEYIKNIAARLVGKIDKIFAYYNIVSLLISYYSYPLLALPVLTLVPFVSKGFDSVSWMLCIACLMLYSLVTFASYKLNQWVNKGEKTVDGKKYAVLMVINIPILLVYFAMFKV